MIECEGMNAKQPVSVLFDPGASLSHVSPKVVEKCQLQRSKFPKPWLVQLAIRTKRRVVTKTERCLITISGEPIHVDINILPLGSHDILIGMDWLERCWSLVESTIEPQVLYFSRLFLSILPTGLFHPALGEFSGYFSPICFPFEGSWKMFLNNFFFKFLETIIILINISQYLIMH